MSSTQTKKEPNLRNDAVTKKKFAKGATIADCAAHAARQAAAAKAAKEKKVAAKADESKKAFASCLKDDPKIMFVLDGSGSMQHQDRYLHAQEGLNVSLMALEGMKQQGMLKDAKVSVAVFSKDTVISPWYSLKQVAEIQAAAENPQMESSMIDACKLFSALTENMAVKPQEPVVFPQALVVFVSDGCIQNWAAAKDGLLGMLREQRSVFISLGEDPRMERDVLNAGIALHRIKEPADVSLAMAGLMTRELMAMAFPTEMRKKFEFTVQL